jgi:chorismate lyase / 3-hydroxybenzoate synthase
MTATQAGSVLEPSARPAAAGAEPAARTAAARFFALHFGHADLADADPKVVPVPLHHAGGAPAWRVWDGVEPARTDGGGIGSLTSPDHVVLHKSVPLTDGADVAVVAREVYRELLARVRELGYPHLVRIWNYVPDINRGAGDRETYVRFNHGRKAAFDLLGFAPSSYPAATGVGAPPGSPLTVVVAASRTEPSAIENPRQTSAYLYPRRYGPRSPAFARATLLPHRDGGTLFISGTASIVGHESQHRGIGPQLAETLANIDRLLECAAGRAPGLRPGARRHWQVYLRDPADLAAVEDEVRARLGGDSVAFLKADICRRELLVEIEGICELTRGAPAPGA